MGSPSRAFQPRFAPWVERVGDTTRDTSGRYGVSCRAERWPSRAEHCRQILRPSGPQGQNCYWLYISNSRMRHHIGRFQTSELFRLYEYADRLNESITCGGITVTTKTSNKPQQNIAQHSIAQQQQQQSSSNKAAATKQQQQSSSNKAAAAAGAITSSIQN